MREAAKLGFSAEGYEVSSFANDFAETHGLRIYRDAARIPRGVYDVVSAVEVLEHCASPLEALQTIYDALKPGGLFFYSTENFDGFYDGWKKGVIDRQADAYIVPEGHINFFSTPVMRAYFRKIGFSQLVPHESPMAYVKSSRLFRILSRCRLIDPSKEMPETSWEKVFYTGTRKILYRMGRKGGPKALLPLARK
jgi:SAM-dependent methyltransferase